MKFSRWVLLVLVLALAGCSALNPSAPTPPGQASTPATATQPVQPAGSDTPAPSASPAGRSHLVVWVPPEFNPGSRTPAGELLQARLNDFSDQNNGVEIEVRVKAEKGQASLLESLTAASAAAPSALPDLVALSRADLETAALKGLLYPLDGLTSTADDADWFSYARALGQIQGSTFGLPFAGDALMLAYRPRDVVGNPADWQAILNQSGLLALPAGSADARLTLTLYAAEGGAYQDEQGRPTLQVEPLTRALDILGDARRREIIPTSISLLEDGAQTWDAYRNLRAALVITNTSSFLADQPPDTTPLPLPPGTKSSLTLANGWLWALASPQQSQHELAASLAEYLTEPAFMAIWTESSGRLPTRPTALAAWQNQGIQPFLSQVALSAQAAPGSDLLATLGPILREATIQVVQNQADPLTAARAAAARLGTE